MIENCEAFLNIIWLIIPTKILLVFYNYVFADKFSRPKEPVKFVYIQFSHWVKG